MKQTLFLFLRQPHAFARTKQAGNFPGLDKFAQSAKIK